ncbi:MAG: PriCT-2 domain-containing protein [Selenomonadaceae bacterium]|nr:PriCT-2 domain-containing protein [Selenomonadaceae bacterium]
MNETIMSGSTSALVGNTTILPAASQEKTKRIAEAERFFNLLFGAVKERKFGYLWSKQGEVRLTFPFDVSNSGERTAMAKKAIELNDAGADVYYGINLTDTPPATNARVTAEHVTLQTATVTDIDIEGGKHISDDKKKYPPTFDTAKSFVPFKTSISVNSGYGLHDLCIYSTPITITEDNRQLAEERNKKFIDFIRSCAGIYSKAVDSVGDLPRVLRVPGTRNYKLGVSQNSPICHIVEANDVRFSPTELDDRLNALTQAQTPKTQSTTTSSTNSAPNSNENFIDDRDFNIFRVRRMLDFIPPSSLTYDDWLAVGMALKNSGCDCSDWENWSRADERFKDGECESKWNGFNREGYDIGTLFMFAHQSGYDAKDIYREWYDLHPSLRPSAKRNMDADTKRAFDNAVILLETLEPENFTANDAYTPENLHAAALATAYGFPALAKKFFDTIKVAQKLAKIRIADSKSELTAKLSSAEKKSLNEIINIGITEIRRYVDRETSAIEKAHASFLKDEERKRLRAKLEKERAEKEARVIETTSRLDELRAMPASPERDAEMIELIRDACDWHCNRQGFKESVKATAANVEKIFTYDPNLDGLIGYDEFQQADVFLKAPTWSNTKKGEEWTDRDDSQLQMYLRKTYTEFANEKLTFNAVTVFSDAHRFHVVKDFFRNLPTWDGKPRAKKLFVKFLGADDIPYVHEVTLNILTAAIARIFHPGCDYQLAPILLGEQGIGKSHCLSRLGGAWYGSLVDDVGDPHAIDAIQKLWFVEIKEMAAMKKDVDANKRFIDSAKDTRRQAYARRAITIPRHCVFVITTNNKMCLTDMTGNRRYPIIVCHNKARHFVEGLTDDYIKQVWAEVFAHYNELFKDGFDEKKLALSRDAQILSDEIAEDYLRDDGMESEIRAYLDIKILPLVLWYLLTREERREFIKNGRLVMLDAVTEFNHRRRAKGGKDSIVQRDVDLISSCLTKTQQKHWLRIERKTIQGNDVEEYILYGSELRQHICAVEIYNECFGNDKRKSPTRINEILNRIDGWSLGARIARADPAYCDQKKVFYRDDD